MATANTRQVDGTHYATNGVQHWDYVIQSLGGRYLEGNITKYVSRCYKKNGLLDVQKAIHYHDKLVEAYGGGLIFPQMAPSPAAAVVMHAFAEDAELDYWQRRVIEAAATWRTRADLDLFRACIHRVLETVYAAEPDRHYVDQG